MNHFRRHFSAAFHSQIPATSGALTKHEKRLKAPVLLCEASFTRTHI